MVYIALLFHIYMTFIFLTRIYDFPKSKTVTVCIGYKRKIIRYFSSLAHNPKKIYMQSVTYIQYIADNIYLYSSFSPFFMIMTANLYYTLFKKL